MSNVQIGVSSFFGTIRVVGGVAGAPGPPGPDTVAAIADHVADSTPHPAYDDIPSMTLVFENGLV